MMATWLTCTKKSKKGRTYYYVRESTSVAGKTKIINQVYLGTAERIMQLALSAKQQGIFKVKSQTFGALWLSNLVEKDIDVVSMIDGIVGQSNKRKRPDHRAVLFIRRDESNGSAEFQKRIARMVCTKRNPVHQTGGYLRA